jgi:hypothetical protein
MSIQDVRTQTLPATGLFLRVQVGSSTWAPNDDYLTLPIESAISAGRPLPCTRRTALDRFHQNYLPIWGTVTYAHVTWTGLSYAHYLIRLFDG